MGSPGLIQAGRPVFRAVACTALGALLVLVFAATVPRLWGWKPVIITSGSMMPLIHPGDVVVERPHPGVVAKDAVVTYEQAGTGRLITHRVVSRAADGDYTIKGDANRQADAQPVPQAHVVGQVRILVPVLGWPALQFSRNPVPATAISAATAGLLGLGVRRYRGRHRKAPAPRAKRLALLRPAPALAMCGCLAASFVVMHDSGAVWSGTRTNASDTLAARGNFAFENQVVADGPISYWPLDETSGTLGHDLVGANPLTYKTGITLGVAGAIAHDADTAIHGGSTTAYATTATNPASLSLTGSLSVMVWERATTWPEGSTARILTKYDGTNLNYLIAWDSAGTSMRFLLDDIGGANTRPTATTAMTNDGLWHMVVGTWDGANAKLYIDGVLKNTASTTGVTSTRTVTSAVTLGLNSSAAIGDMDEAAVWGRALSATEISTLYSAATT